MDLLGELFEARDYGTHLASIFLVFWRRSIDYCWKDRDGICLAREGIACYASRSCSEGRGRGVGFAEVSKESSRPSGRPDSRHFGKKRCRAAAAGRREAFYMNESAMAVAVTYCTRC